MRKVLLFVFLLVCSYSFGQPIVNRAGAANTVADANLFALRSFRPPVYADTMSANNAYPTLDSAGKVFYSFNDKAIWFRQHSPKKWVKLADQNLVNNVTGCYGLLNGGVVTWSGTGLVMNVTAAYYVINCNYYNSEGSLSVTLDAADPSNPRIDVIAVDTAQNIVVIKGTAGVNPVKPQVNPTYQVELTEIYVPAGATTPQDYTYKTVYNENTEWTSGSALSSGTANFNSTVFPSVGTKNLRVSASTVGHVYWDTIGAFLPSGYQSLSLRFSLASTHTNDIIPYIYLRDNGVQVTYSLALDGFGYSSVSGLNEYNVITIPMSAFTFTSGSTFDGIGLYFGGIGAIVDVDYVQLQTGTNGGGVIGNYIEGIRRLAGSTDVEGLKNGVWQYLFTDSTGSGGSSYIFSEGLTESGGTVKLGGTISESRQILGTGGGSLYIDSLIYFIAGAKTWPDRTALLSYSNNATIQYRNQNNIHNEIGLTTSLSYIRSGLATTDYSFFKTQRTDSSARIMSISKKVFIDSINTVSSTTGRKLLVHDTATGKVERVDPALLGNNATLYKSGDSIYLNNGAIIYAVKDSIAGINNLGVAQTMYLDASTSFYDNQTLSPVPSSYPQETDVKAVTSATSPGFLERFVSGPVNTTSLPAGTWIVKTYGSTSNATGDNRIVTRINKRVLMEGMTGTFTGAGATRTFTVTGGTPFVPGDATSSRLTASLIETPNQTAWISGYISSSVVTVTLTDVGYVNESNVTLNAMYYLLFSTTSNDLTTSPTLSEISSAQSAFTVNVTDRLVAAYFATTDGAASRNISLYHGGSVNYSNVVTTLGSTGIDTTSLSNRINQKQNISDTNTVDATRYWVQQQGYADSLRRSGLAVQMQKGGVWTTQFNLPDSAGGGGDSSFSQITIGDKIKVGTVLNHEWSSGITGWTDNTPSATVTAGTGYVEFSGGGNNYSNAIKYNNTTVSSHDVVLKTDIVVLNKTSTSYGVALSLTPKGNGSSLLVNFMLSDTAGYITTGSFSSRGTSIFKWSANDTLSLEVTRAGRNLICKMTNKANGSVNKLTYPDNMGSVGIPEIYTLGLNFRLVNNYEIIDNSISAPKYIVLGNSIAFGSLSVSESTRWQTFAFDGDGGEVVDLSGPSERALDGWYKVQEIVQRYNPNYVLWCYGVNDLNVATNVDSVRARIERSFDTLLAHGITPIGISGTPQSSNIDPYNTVLQEECTERSLLYVDVTTLLRNGGVGLATQYNYGDNIHLSEAGNEVFGNAVNFALKKEGILKDSSSVDISNLPITDRSDYDVVLDYNNSIALRHRGGDVRSYIKNWPFLSATIKQPGNINLDGTAWLKKAVIGSVPQSGGPTTIDDGGINTNSIYAGYNKFIVTPSAGYINNLGFIISTYFLYRALSIPLYFEQQNPASAGGNFIHLSTMSSAPFNHKFLSISDVSDTIFSVKKNGKINLFSGSNASVGTGTLSSGTVTISTTAVTSSSLIFVQYTSCSSCGSTYIGTITNGTSFVVNSTNGSDASTFNWWIIN